MSEASQQDGRIFRMTKQRQAILQEVQGTKTHPTADEVYRRVRLRMPFVSLGTVYRNLEILSQCGLIRKIDLSEGQRRFDGTMEDHYHVQCTECGKIGDVWIAPPASLEAAKEQAGDYQVMGLRLEFFGLCPTCGKHVGKGKSARKQR